MSAFLGMTQIHFQDLLILKKNPPIEMMK